MSLFDSFAISASGLAVQRERMEVTSENLANVNSTRTPEGGPYQKKDVVVTSVPLSFEAGLEAAMGDLGGGRGAIQGARVAGVVKTNHPPKMIFDPAHPDANQEGYVAMPDINVTQELVDVLTATRTYEANLSVLNASKSMVLRTLELGAA